MTGPVTDPKDAMCQELHAKARLLLQNAIGPVITEVGQNYGREGVIAFCAALQANFAVETRAAFGTGVAMEIMKNVVANVMKDHADQAEQELYRSAHEALTKMPLQGKKPH